MADQFIELATPGVLSEIIDGEVVAIHSTSGQYFSITGSGIHLWQCLQQSATVTEMIDVVAASPDAVEPAEAVHSFLSSVKEAGLVREAVGTRNGPLTVAPATTYVAPGFEAFSDLDDLLLLDPIHEVDEQGWPHTPLQV